MRGEGSRVWRHAIGVAPLAILFLGRGAAADPVCKDSGVTVSFRSGSAEIDRSGQGALSGVATWAQNGDQRTVRLEGYADRAGGATGNQRLSERRAQAAEDFLLGKGVDAARIAVVGHGEEMAGNLTGADARVVKVETCDVRRTVAEATP
ncbi:MAG TPA: OmpA family protein, partial [Polyangia bacterium]|nr:OmpA family protein [Polyangia bacterium]